MVETAAVPVTRHCVRVMELDDVSFAVRLHREVLPHGFFVELGPRFLAEYYRSYLTSPAAIALVAVADANPVGFAVGTVDRDAHYRHVVRSDRVRLAAFGVVGLVVHPRQAVRFVRTRAGRYLRGIHRFSAAPDPDECAGRLCRGVLSHLAVSPAFAGRGFGGQLVDSFTDVICAAGAPRADVATRSDNVAARCLYEGRSWCVFSELVDVAGHHWTTYRLELP